MFAHDMLLAGTHEVMVAGGMESMTNAPYLMPKGRGGYRMGHDKMFDHMMLDGLEDAYAGRGRSMGTFGEDCAAKYQFTREAQDAFAIASRQARAEAATDDGAFDWEIAPVTVTDRAGDTVIDNDEGPVKAKLDKIPTLKPAFKKDGTITAASSSSINDGAAALVMMREIDREAPGRASRSRASSATPRTRRSPNWFTTAPVGAIAKLLTEDRLEASSDVDLWEVNEAFAVVPMALMQELDIPHDKVNVHGGACALGHPIGASGARIMVTLLGALKKTRRQARRRDAVHRRRRGDGVALELV